MRFLIATAGGAALVSEASEDEGPARRNKHVVEVARSDLASAVTELIADETRRRALVEASQELLRADLAMASCVGRVLEPSLGNMPRA
jgi:hypothetical protein